MKNQLLNKVYLVLDKSGSMGKISNTVVRVIDDQIKHWTNRSKELNQETRLSVYLFSDKTECIYQDRDVSRFGSIKRDYQIGGNTSLIDSTLKAIEDGRDNSSRNKNESHLVIVISDGQNNINNHKADYLRKTINNLPENWTVSCLVPNAQSLHEAKTFGFPAQNISVWDASSDDGVEEMGRVLTNATSSYYLGRSSGMRGTKQLFTLDSSKLDTKKVKKNLQELNHREYDLLPVHNTAKIKDYVESFLGEYKIGSAYYEMTKPEVVQSGKQLAVQNKLNGKIYVGTQARELLNLPSYEVKVNPVNHGQYRLFCQSHSVNRNLVRGTQLLVLK